MCVQVWVCALQTAYASFACWMRPESFPMSMENPAEFSLHQGTASVGTVNGNPKNVCTHTSMWICSKTTCVFLGVYVCRCRDFLSYLGQWKYIGESLRSKGTKRGRWEHQHSERKRARGEISVFFFSIFPSSLSLHLSHSLIFCLLRFPFTISVILWSSFASFFCTFVWVVWMHFAVKVSAKDHW